MRTCFCFLLCVLLASCATAPVTKAPAPERLFSDHLFSAPSVPIVADDVFALSAEMKRYLSTHIVSRIRVAGSRQALFDALYSKLQLQLEYDSAMTRNAAQAFAARAGNCLSLVIMTAAFAKELDLPVRYQTVYLDPTWSRAGDIEFFSGHVNLSLGKNLVDISSGRREAEQMTVDFLPPLEIRGLHTRDVAEATIVAMYLNNKAAESLALGQLDDAYGWARAAIEQDPGFTSSYNTLGVIYQRHGDLAEAEQALKYSLEHDPGNTHAMSNLANVLKAQGRVAESEAMSRRLAQVEPDPPFAFFYRGVIAMRNRDFKSAEALFAKEADRAPYYDEFRFWLAAAYVGLGQFEQARKQLNLAIEYSTNSSRRDIYAVKLARIMSLLPQ